MSKKYVLFLRVSTVKQDYLQQVASLKGLAKNDGVPEDAKYIIIGATESGRKLAENERKTITELKRVIEEEDVDTVYTFEISRLARRMDVLISIRDTLEKRKIQLSNYTPQFKLLKDDRSEIRTDSRLIFSLFGTIAEQEAITLRARVLKAFADKAEKGEVVGGSVPFGYKFDENKKLIIDESESKIVKYIFDRYEAGYSQSQIARELKVMIPDVSFLLSRVSNILSNELYTGKVREAGAVQLDKNGNVQRSFKYPRQYPPIITEEQFKRCREIAKENTNQRTPSKHLYYGYRLIRCPECGGVWSGGSQRNAYRCSNAYNHLRDIGNFGKIDCTYKHNISINLLDSLLWHLASSLEAKYILQDTARNKKEYEEKINLFRKKLDFVLGELAKVDEKKERIADAYADGVYTKEKYKKKLKQVSDETQSFEIEKTGYEHQIEQLEELIQGLDNKNLYVNKVGLPILQSKDIVGLTQEIREKTTEEQLRYEIIHRHIMEVRIYVSYVDWESKHLGRMCRSQLKKIEIKKFQGETTYYYYLSHFNKLFFDDPSVNPKSELNIEVIKRFGDIRRVRLKEKREIKRQEFKKQFEGYYTRKEAMEVFGFSLSTATHLPRFGVPYTHFGKFIAFKKEDVEAFAKEYASIGNLSTRDVADKLGFDLKVIQDAIYTGKLKATLYRRRFYIKESDFNSYKKSLGK